MKFLTIFLIAILNCHPQHGHVSPVFERPSSTKPIENALKSGSSKDLYRFMGENVAINLGNKRGDYSRNQAEMIIRDFFKKFPPHDFKVLHQNTPSERTRVLIGRYESKNGLFRTLVKSKMGHDRQLKVYSLELVKE